MVTIRWWRHRAEYLAFRGLVACLGWLSPRQTARLAEWAGTCVSRYLPHRLTRYPIAAENLRQALGADLPDAEVDRILRGMWVHLFRLVAEIVQMPRYLTLDHVHDVIDFVGKRPVLEALLSDRPVILLGGHFGNWEVGVRVFGLFGFPVGVVARELDNPLLNAWFAQFRSGTGHQLIGKKGFEEMIARLETGGRIALLGDQDAGRGGVFVDFFGRPASTPKTIALLALEYDALIVVGGARRLEGPAAWVRYEFRCEEIVDPRTAAGTEAVREITQQYTHALERMIRRAPEQYFWVHRRWKTPPGARRRKRRDAPVETAGESERR